MSDNSQVLVGGTRLVVCGLALMYWQDVWSCC